MDYKNILSPEKTNVRSRHDHEHPDLRLSPLHRLQSGYSYVSLPGGSAVTSIEQITPGDTIDVYVTDGSYRAAVLSKAKKGDIGNG